MRPGVSEVSSSGHCLVVAPSWVGDMVMAQSLFISLKQRSPGLLIDVLAPAWSRPLLDRMVQVNQALDMPLGHGELELIARYRIGKSLRRRRYSSAYVLPNSFKSALIPYWARIPVRTGYRGELRGGLLNDVRTLDKQRLRQTVQRFVALGQQPDEKQLPLIPLPQLSVDVKARDRCVQHFDIEPDAGPVAVLCPGAEYGPAKRWPATHFARLADILSERGWQIWLMGSPADRGCSEHIIAQAQSAPLDLCGKTSLAEAIDLMSYAGLVVSNDSGAMHIAAALDRPLLAIYGSSDPGFTPPLGRRSRIVSLDLECSPCFKRECPLGHLNCLNQLGPDKVIAAADGLGVFQ